jgi:hypothetical protein
MERHRPLSIPIKEDLLYSRHWGRATQAHQARPTPQARLFVRLVETTGQSEAFDEVISALPD